MNPLNLIVLFINAMKKSRCNESVAQSRPHQLNKSKYISHRRDARIAPASHPPHARFMPASCPLHALVARHLHWQSRCMAAPEKHPHYESWPPPRAPGDANPMPSWSVTLWRGVCGRCPRCDKAPIFDGYLAVHPTCLNCSAPFGNLPADDAPPYIAMVVVLQVLGVFVVLFYKGYYHPGIVMSGFLLVMLVIACMAALRLAKGAVIGILLKLGMRRETIDT
jgi:uncharacterized protein (DUF983 family)